MCAEQWLRSARLLVVLPGWVGDCAMATPALRALRRELPGAHISALVRANLAPLFDPCPWFDELILLPPRRRGVPGAWPVGLARTARALRERRFDAALLLPGSFRSALEVRLAGIPRRIGYPGDLRSLLLTDVVPRRRPVSTLAQYLGLARALGVDVGDAHLELHTDAGDDARTDELLAAAGADGVPGFVLLNPGAGTRRSKIWPAERFAALARRCREELGLAVAVNGSGSHRAPVERILAAAGVPALDLERLGVDLRLLKSVVRAARVVVGNDTGPRHLAVALDTPAVTIFGPTDPERTATGSRLEREVRGRTWCSPCPFPRCPIGHGCMRNVSVDAVFAAVAAAVGETAGQGERAGRRGHGAP